MKKKRGERDSHTGLTHGETNEILGDTFGSQTEGEGRRREGEGPAQLKEKGRRHSNDALLRMAAE